MNRALNPAMETDAIVRSELLIVDWILDFGFCGHVDVVVDGAGRAARRPC